MALLPPNRNTQPGSGFQNVQNLISGNKGSVMGQVIGRNIQSAGQNAAQKLEQGKSQFQAGIGDSQQQIAAGQKAATDINAATSSADVAGVGNTDNTKAAQNIYGGYKGPQGIEDSTNIYNQMARANTLGQKTQSQGGRNALLQQMASRPGQQYTQQQRKLDNLNLQQNNQALNQAYQQTKGLENKAVNELGAAEAQAQGLTNQFSNIQSQLTTGIAKQDAALRQRLEAEMGSRNTQSKQMADAITGRLQSGTYTQQDLDTLKSIGIDPSAPGMTPEEVSRMIQANVIQDYGNVASEQDLTALKNLQGLAKQGTKFGTSIDDTEVNTGRVGIGYDKEQYDTVYKPIQESFARSQALPAEMKSRTTAAQNITSIIPFIDGGTPPAELAKEWGLDQGTIDYITAMRAKGASAHSIGQDLWRQGDQLSAEQQQLSDKYNGFASLQGLLNAKNTANNVARDLARGSSVKMGMG